MNERLDLVVIGSGPGGYRAAILGALRGLTVAVVEKGEWGGCCLNRGCVPKKDWYHTARLMAASRGFAARGLRGELAPDLGNAWKHQGEVVRTVRESYVDYMKRLGVRLFQGRAELLDSETVQVTAPAGDRRTLTAVHIILATGARPHTPDNLQPVPGRILTTDMLFDEPPPQGPRVAVIGSGIVATEFAYIFTMLGLSVTWLARSAPLGKTPFSPQALSALGDAFARAGIEVRQGVAVETSEITGNGVRLALSDGDEFTVDWVCLGTGRTPVTDGLGLAAAGIETDGEGFVRRNEHLQTTAPNVYAVGDCASRRMTANQALADATVAVDNIIRGNTRKGESLWVPLVVYSAVEMARVGLNDDMAENAGLEPAVGFAAFATSPCALGQDEVEGFVRILADMDSGELLGGEIIGRDAGELIQLLAFAPGRETALRWLAEGRYNHPARAEELLNAVETLANRWGLKDKVFG